MSSDELKDYLDDIVEILTENTEHDIKRDELEEEFKRFLEYGVPLEQAKQTLLKKYGGAVSQPTSDERITLDCLSADQNSVRLRCRVLSISPRDINVKGEQRTIYYGILGDESGTLPFTAWQDYQLEKGDVIEIYNAYTREWQGATKINFGDRTKIEKTDSSKLPQTQMQPQTLQIKDLRAGFSNIEVTARILEINKRQITVGDTKKTVFSGILGDETGKAQFTAWHDYQLKKDDVLKIKGGYVKTWKGIPQVSFDEKATVEKLDSSTIPKKQITTHTVTLAELNDQWGALDVETKGVIIEIRPGSGYITRCPTCNRTIQKNTCPDHGEVTPVDDLRLKLIVDDGMGAVTTIIGKELTEHLLGKTLKDIKTLQTKTEGERLVFQELTTKLFGHMLTLQGNALGDEYGITFIAKQAYLTPLNVQQEAEQIQQALEELL